MAFDGFDAELHHVVDLDSDDDFSETSKSEVPQKRIAKKSTAAPIGPDVKAAVTRRQAAIANNKKIANSSYDRFMENFDPERSSRERRKLTRKVNAVSAPIRKIPGAVYDENGIHIVSGVDLCDCLDPKCPGCHFPCPKCKSLKCGAECRCNRKFIYESMEYNGCDIVVTNPLLPKRN